MKESNRFFSIFQFITLSHWFKSYPLRNSIIFLKFWPVIYKELFFWTRYHHHHRPFASLFYMLFRMYDMGKDFHAHLNAKLTGCTWSSKYKNHFQNIWKKQIETYWENAQIRSVSFWEAIVVLNQVIQQSYKEVWVLLNQVIQQSYKEVWVLWE